MKFVMDNTVADISVLEGIQNQANAAMDAPQSGMTIFNATFKVFDASKHDSLNKKCRMEIIKSKFEEEERYLSSTVSEYQKRKKKFEELHQKKKSGTWDKKLEQEFNIASSEYGRLQRSRIDCRGRMQQQAKELESFGVLASSSALKFQD
jgi:predicted  nucleic acid-binding Zn-ribbon protein